MEEQPQRNTTEKLGVSDAPTLPVRRRLAWDAENTDEGVQKQPGEEEGEEETGKDQQLHAGELEKVEVQEKSKADKIKEG